MTNILRFYYAFGVNHRIWEVDYENQNVHSFGSGRSLYGHGLRRFRRRRARFTIRFFRLDLPSGNGLHTPADRLPDRHVGTCQHPDARCSGNGSAAGSFPASRPAVPTQAAYVQTPESCAYRQRRRRRPTISPVPTPEAPAAPNGNARRPFRSHDRGPRSSPFLPRRNTPEPTRNPVIATPSPSTGNDYTTGSITAQEENAFLLLNQDRAANGRSALTLDPALCALARLKSQRHEREPLLSPTPPPRWAARRRCFETTAMPSPPSGRISPTTPPWRRRRPRLCPAPDTAPTFLVVSGRRSVSAYAPTARDMST